MVIGALQQEPGNAAEPGSTSASPGWSLSMGSTTSYFWNSATFTSTNALTFAANDVAMVALDLDNGKIWWGKNGTWHNSGSPSSGTNAQYTNIGTGIPTGFHVSNEQRGVTEQTVNFGQRAFAYTAPSGFKALCTANLPAPLVTKPNTVMDVALYTGNGSTQTISGLGFSPDLVWIKSRNYADVHKLFDVIRTAGYELRSDTTDSENYDSTTLTSFNSNGFGLGSNPGSNRNAYPFVAWAWDAGSSTVTNTQGSITSSVRANATAGFSVVTFNTGSSGDKTVGHGLNIAPSLILLKSRATVENWSVFHSSVCDSVVKYLILNSTSALLSNAQIWGAALPTSSVFGIRSGTASTTNTDMVAYCFAPVVGYSSFGSYTGNGSTDGPFVFCGFRPRYILRKRTDTSGPSWRVIDAARNTYNLANEILEPNTSDATENNNEIDILSNGFKVRSADTDGNASGGTIIYAAFAESPFNYARAR
jgi:hypothetical protein